ncbi:MAG: 2-amino-4-hydroxy-6-hydroxymethyldihydropteridine diphosphokinase [Treponema sp.]|nr:2-amino-4-hydroxy-6-hydroxymethyldihydropteridine diphosphokinase [Treponema sp.]
MKRVLLGLGSNKTYEGHSSLELLSFARKELALIMNNCSFSSVYRTKAMYVEDQDDFYNMAALGYVEDSTNPFEFLKKINEIEAKYGRDRDKEVRFGPRSLDIDIELFGDEKISDPVLQIPHIRIEERAFVLVPALEILNNSADELIREKYSACLLKLKKEGKADGIEKIL